MHEGDTYYSAEDCKANLSAWELKYSIDNDDTKYYWADTENGKGVIYWLKDDWGNECPYDFKQIQFKRYKITACDKCPGLIGQFAAKEKSNDITTDEEEYIWCYTFHVFSDLSNLEGSENYDFSVFQNKFNSEEYAIAHCYNNIILPRYAYSQYSSSTASVELNNIILWNVINDDNWVYPCNSNTFGNDCYSNTFGNACYSNTFGNNCYFNTFGNACYFNTFGNACYFNTFGNACYFNTFGNYCYQCTFNNGVQYINLNNNSATIGNQIKNYHILSGTQGTSSNKITIAASLGLSYCTYVGKNSSGAVKTWVPADLVQ